MHRNVEGKGILGDVSVAQIDEVGKGWACAMHMRV